MAVLCLNLQYGVKFSEYLVGRIMMYPRISLIIAVNIFFLD